MNIILIIIDDSLRALSRIHPVRFPVKITSPPTAILYITEDFEYISQLKDTLHVKEVEIGRNNR
jgi:hypothetical protein